MSACLRNQTHRYNRISRELSMARTILSSYVTETSLEGASKILQWKTNARTRDEEVKCSQGCHCFSMIAARVFSKHTYERHGHNVTSQERRFKCEAPQSRKLEGRKETHISWSQDCAEPFSVWLSRVFRFLQNYPAYCMGEQALVVLQWQDVAEQTHYTGSRGT